MCCQFAWHAVTQQGRNVVIFTSETLRSQVRFRILARHSRDPRFGLSKGINTRDMKAGTLQDKNAFAAVLHDFSPMTPMAAATSRRCRAAPPWPRWSPGWPGWPGTGPRIW